MLGKGHGGLDKAPTNCFFQRFQEADGRRPLHQNGEGRDLECFELLLDYSLACLVNFKSISTSNFINLFAAS